MIFPTHHSPTEGLCMSSDHQGPSTLVSPLGKKTEKGTLLPVFWRWVRKCAFKWSGAGGKESWKRSDCPEICFSPSTGKALETPLGSYCKNLDSPTLCPGDLDSPTLCPGLIQRFTISAFDFHGFRHDHGGTGEARKCGFQQTPLLCSLQNGERRQPSNELDFTGSESPSHLESCSDSIPHPQILLHHNIPSSVITVPPAPQPLLLSWVVFCEHSSLSAAFYMELISI